MDRVTFADLLARWTWRPIRNCPGRYALSGVRRPLTPRALVGDEVEILELSVDIAPDRVIVAPLDGGGLISYRRADGTYVHTLNDLAGFSRKLDQLGIVLPIVF